MLNMDSNETIESIENNEETPPNKQWPQWLATFSVTLGMFNVGLLYSWSSPTLFILLSPNSPIDVTWDDVALITSAMQLGSGFGPIPGALIIMYFGPKVCVLISALMYIIGYVLIIFATTANMLVFARLISGIAVGFSFAATPIYISEIAEKHIRGSLMYVFTIALNSGSVFVTFIAPYVGIDTMAEIMITIPILLILTFVFFPETPYYYVRNNKDDKAYDSIQRLRKQLDDSVIKREIDNIKASTTLKKTLGQSFKEFFSNPNPKALFIVCLIVTCQQCCGAVFSIFYLTILYIKADIPFDPNFGAMLTSIISIIFTIFVIPLTDKWGRKPLLHISAIGCIISDIIIAIYYNLDESIKKSSDWYIIPIIAFNVLQISFSVGLGPIPYTIAGEIFSGNVKEIGICTLSIFGAILGFLITRFFAQFITNTINIANTFFVTAFVTFLLWLLILIIVPETKNKNFQDIQDILKNKKFYIPCVGK